MSERARNALALAAWTAFLVAALAALQGLGSGPLAAPPLRGFRAWLDDRDAPTVVFAVLRLGLLGTGWYLLVSTLLATALRFARADTAAGAVEACAPAPVRRLVRAAAGLSFAASVVAVSAASANEPDEPVTMRRLPDAEVRVLDGGGGEADGDETVTMTRLPDIPELAPPPAPAPAATTWTVAAGDHLWSIARHSLTAAWNRPPTDAEVDPYWRQLIERNRPRLPDPANPDLIHPGLRIDLPPAPSRPVR